MSIKCTRILSDSVVVFSLSGEAHKASTISSGKQRVKDSRRHRVALPAPPPRGGYSVLRSSTRIRNLRARVRGLGYLVNLVPGRLVVGTDVDFTEQAEGDELDAH